MDKEFPNIQDGMKVLTRDGREIGTVRHFSSNRLEVECGKGLFGSDSDRLWIPASNIDHVERNAVVVDKAYGDIEGAGWGRDFDLDARLGRKHSDLDRDDTIELKEEELRARKYSEQVGEVRISKHVEEQERSVEVPVMHEEVTIERRAVNRPADGDFMDDDQTIRVPIHAEEAELEKRAHVYEEIDVDKTQVSDSQRMSGTVRREVADLDTDGDVDVNRSGRFTRDTDDRSQPSL